jgi:hypothetical protein
VFVNLDRYGNTSAASIPLVLDDAYQQGAIHKGDLVMGGVVSSIGDVFGGAADFVGDVVGGVGDFVGDVASNIDIEDAVKAYVMSGGNPYAAAFAATDFDEDLGFNPMSFYDPASGGFSFAPGNVPGGGGYQGGFIKTGIDTLDQALSLAKSGYDIYNLYERSNQENINGRKG